MTTTTATQIVARDLHKSYDNGTVKALRGVSIEIAEGEFLAIMGQSGSGKSTLLHMLGTLDSPDQGELLFEGKPVGQIPHLDRFRAANIGFVFQMHFLLPHLSLLDNVMVPMEPMGKLSRAEKRERATAALESVGLGHRITHTPTKVSGGERQRAAIARAIVNRPGILLADEPTGNVDSETEGMVLDLFDRFRAELGATLVVVTHDAGVARRAGRVLMMRDGKLLDQVPEGYGKH